VGEVGILGSGVVVDEESEEERSEREARNAGSALGIVAGLAIGAVLSQKEDSEADEEDEDYVRSRSCPCNVGRGLAPAANDKGGL